jgi:hypothetical protein
VAAAVDGAVALMVGSRRPALATARLPRPRLHLRQALRSRPLEAPRLLRRRLLDKRLHQRAVCSASAEPSDRGGRGGNGRNGGGAMGGGGGGGFGGGGGGGFRGGRGGDPAEFQARMLERFKTMPPDGQTQLIARMKQRGVDTSAFEHAAPSKAPKKAGASGNSQGAQTIDALFAPLPPVESRGRAWLFIPISS